MLLSGHKSKTFSQFKKELLNVVDDGFFYFRFDITGIIGKAEKLKDGWIFDKFQLVMLEILSSLEYLLYISII